MKNSFTASSSTERLMEDELYALVYEEIETGQMDKSAQARAIEEGGSDNGAVRKAYIKNRILRLKAELELARREKEKEIEKSEMFGLVREGSKTKLPGWRHFFGILGLFVAIAFLIAMVSQP